MASTHGDGEYVDEMWETPFLGKTPDEMKNLVLAFFARASTTESGKQTSIFDVDERKVIARAAFLAQDAEALEPAHHNEERQLKHGVITDMIREIHPDDDSPRVELEQNEFDILSWETDKKINQSSTMVLLVLVASLGAAAQGMNETAATSAQLFYDRAFGIVDDKQLQGLVHSAPYLCCAFSCLLAHELNNRLGRKWTVFVTCAISVISSFWQFWPNSWQHMYAARFILGFGIGPKSATIPIWSAECAPSNVRGRLTMFWQTFTAFGIMLGYVCGAMFLEVRNGYNEEVCPADGPSSLLLSWDCSLNWRLIIMSPIILPLIAMFLIPSLPESPRYLLQQARKTGNPQYYKEAYVALRRLRNSALQAGRDLFLMDTLLEEELRMRRWKNLWVRLAELFTKGRNYRALRASVTCFMLQQWCGVNAHVYYSGYLFNASGLNFKSSILGGLGFGIINFVGAFPAFFLIDKKRFGRRNLLLFTFPLMAAFHLMTGLAFLAPRYSETRQSVAILGVFLFTAAYSPGEGPVPFVYGAESMPLYVRDLGMSIATSINWLNNFLVAFTFHPLLDRANGLGTMSFYALCCAIGWFIILFFVPETRGLSLEELDQVFRIRTGDYAIYARAEVRYFFAKYVAGKRKRRPNLLVTRRGGGPMLPMLPMDPRTE